MKQRRKSSYGDRKCSITKCNNTLKLSGCYLNFPIEKRYKSMVCQPTTSPLGLSCFITIFGRKDLLRRIYLSFGMVFSIRYVTLCFIFFYIYSFSNRIFRLFPNENPFHITKSADLLVILQRNPLLMLTQNKRNKIKIHEMRDWKLYKSLVFTCNNSIHNNDKLQQNFYRRRCSLKFCYCYCWGLLCDWFDVL